MGIVIDPATGITTEDSAVIQVAIQADWLAIFNEEGEPPLNVEASSPAGQIIDSMTALVTAKDSELAYLASMFNPDVAEGRWQDALGKIYFISRKIAEPTVVTCRCTGLQGTVIPAGSLARTDDGITLLSIDAVTIPSGGAVDVFFRTEGTGEIEMPAGTVNTIVTTIPGWDTIANAAAGRAGRITESRAEFEKRRKMSVANNAHGSAVAVESSIAAIDGVLDCKVVENDTSGMIYEHGVAIEPHSLYISVYGGSDEDIARAIYLKKSGGCATSTGNTQVTHVAEDFHGATYVYNIMRPTPIAFRIKIEIELVSNTPSTVVDDLKQALYDDFYGNNTASANTRIGMASRIFASRFYVAAIKTAGVVSLVTLQIALNAGSFSDVVDISADITPVLTFDDIDVIYTNV